MNQVITFHNRKPAPISVNGETISLEEIDALAPQFADADKPREAAARALVVRALLRQRAAALQIEAADEESALEQVLVREVPAQSVSDEEVRRYFEGHREKFRSGDLFEARHILFEAGPQEDRIALAKRADALLLALKNNPDRFEQFAREASTCTSASLGGSLGQLTEGSVVPEFWSALVAFGKPGLLPQPVETRFGCHIIRIDRCALGEALPLEAVQERIRAYLNARLEQLGQQQYVARLIEGAQISGIDLGNTGPQGAGPGLPTE